MTVMKPHMKNRLASRASDLPYRAGPAAGLPVVAAVGIAGMEDLSSVDLIFV
jgi:hypothetical protein